MSNSHWFSSWNTDELVEAWCYFSNWFMTSEGNNSAELTTRNEQLRPRGSRETRRQLNSSQHADQSLPGFPSVDILKKCPQRTRSCPSGGAAVCQGLVHEWGKNGAGDRWAGWCCICCGEERAEPKVNLRFHPHLRSRAPSRDRKNEIVDTNSYAAPLRVRVRGLEPQTKQQTGGGVRYELAGVNTGTSGRC